jgi:hypothetical protein
MINQFRDFRPTQFPASTGIRNGLCVIILVFIASMMMLIGTVAWSLGRDDTWSGPHASDCDDCHLLRGASYPKFLAKLCQSCHFVGSPVVSAESAIVKTHSSKTTGDGYGNWDLDCWSCHNPHTQEQNIHWGSTYGKYIKKNFGTSFTSRSPTTIKEINPGDAGPYYTPIGTIRTITSDEVEFIGNTEFVDNDGLTVDDICQVCHENTNNYGSSDIDNHTDYGPGSQPGGNCTAVCHLHTAGFRPSATGQSHDTHLTEQFGPEIDCVDCHGSHSPPLFADNNDLATTTVCDTCHSPGGTYDGVNDPAIGAKANWDNGIYTSNVLSTGRDKWCAGCHDEVPSVIQSISAPNIIGDEDAATNYGTGYGYYKTGHGLPVIEKYPASGGTISGADLSCGYCHDFTLKHIDGVARTYVYTATEGNDDDYQHGYRLKSINGLAPMDMPRADGCESGVEATDFRLCFSCHDSGPFTSASNYDTSFRRTGTPDYNAHYNHLAIQDGCGPGPVFQSDWDAGHGYDSRASCVTCHNVHGSTQLSMVRSGELVGRTGQEVLYYKPGVNYDCFSYPDIDNVSLVESTGTIWAQNNGLCSTCHGSCGFDSLYLRSPFDNTPPRITKVTGETGSDVLTVSFSEGIYSDLNQTDNLVIGDFILTDADDGRAINGVTHVAGNDSATITLDLALDGTNDIGTDTLAAASATSIYDTSNLPMDTTPVVISNTAVGDTDPPTLSNQSPANNATGIDVFTDLTFTIADSGSEVDWSTFAIELAGDQGYSKLYTDEDFTIVSKTGLPASYDVTVNPDDDFSELEVITVNVNVDDYNGNLLVPPAWSFTTGVTAAPQTATLHPSSLNYQHANTWTITSSWATDLDDREDPPVNDSNPHVKRCCTGGPTSNYAYFWLNMDDFNMPSATVNNITIKVWARHRVQGGTDSPTTGPVDVGYYTGTGESWLGDTTTLNLGNYTYTLIEHVVTQDTDGGDLDPSEIDNLQIGVKRSTHANEMRVTEVTVEVEYIP